MFWYENGIVLKSRSILLIVLLGAVLGFGATAHSVLAVSTVTATPDQGPTGTLAALTAIAGTFGNTDSLTFDDSGSLNEITCPATSSQADGSLSGETCTVNSNTTPGLDTITVTDSTTPADSTTFTFTINQPSITVTEASGHVGDTVHVTAGTGFIPGSSVTTKFGSQTVNTQTADSTDGHITAFTFTVPAVTADSFGGPHTITASDGTNPATSSYTITPHITGVIGGTGNVGTSVSISGTGFDASSQINIRFDNANTTTTSTSDGFGSFTSVAFTIPTSTGGSHNVGASTSSTNTVDDGSFTVTPHITNVNPGTGTVGSSTQVSGTGFDASSQVNIRFDNANTTFTGTTDGLGSFTNVALTIPTAVFGSHNVGASTSSTNTIDDSSFSVTPQVTSLTPNHAQVGATVTIAGNGFDASNPLSVTVSGTPATISASTDGNGVIPPSTTFTVPLVVAESTNVVATTNSHSTPGFSFTVDAPSLVLNNTAGPHGTVVLLSGSGYGPGSTLTITNIDGTNPPTVTADGSGNIPADTTVTIPASQSQAFIRVSDGTNQQDATFTQTSPTTTITSSQTGHVGDSVTLSGANFIPHSTVTVSFGSTSVGTVTADLTGAFSGFTFNVPDATTDSVAGDHHVTGTDGTNTSPSAAGNTFTITPFISSSSSPLHVGETYTYTGTGFAAGASTVKVDGTLVGSFIAGGTADSNGDLPTTQFSFPHVVQGSHNVQAFDFASNPSNTLSATINPFIIVTSATTGHVGDTFTYIGSGFAAGASTATFDGVGQTLSGGVTADASGNLAATSFTVPHDTKGSKNIIATDFGSTASNTVTFTINPVITSVTGGSLAPTSGYVGDTLTVAGTGFAAGAATLDFNSVDQTATGSTTVGSNGDLPGTATFLVPAIAKGSYPVGAKDSGSTVADNPVSFAVNPHISSSTVTPGHVGDTYTYTGTGFAAGASTATFGGDSQTLSGGITADASGNLAATSFTVPHKVQGAYDVIASDSGSTASNTLSFTINPFIASSTVSPGHVGDTYTYTGTGFAAGASTAKFDGVGQTLSGGVTADGSGDLAATSFTVPHVTQGSKNIVATDFGSTDSNTLTFTVNPFITSVAAPTGHVADTPTISGTGFAQGGSDTATVGGTSATVGEGSSVTAAGDLSTFTIIIPHKVHGTYDVLVTTNGQTNDNTPGTQTFTINPDLTITGAASGNVGATTTVTGTGYSTGTVTINWDVPAGSAGSGSADASGDLSTTSVTIPNSVAGPHTITGTDSSSTTNDNPVTFTVDPSVTTDYQQGPHGTVVTFNGAGWMGSGTITITNLDASTSTTSSSSVGDFGPVTVTVPNSATTAGNPFFFSTTDSDSNGPVASPFTLTTSAITLTPNSGSVGTAVSVGGLNFIQNVPVTIRYDGTNIGTVTSDPGQDGHFTKSVNIPLSTPGHHTIAAFDSDNQPTALFVVGGPSLTLSTSSGPVGTSTTVTGEGFAASSTVTVTNVDGSTTTANTDTTGSFTKTITIGSSVTGSSPNVSASDGSQTATAPFTISSSTLSLSPTTGPVGTTVTVSGSGFAASTTITFTFGGTPVTTTPALVTSDASGNIPSGVTFTVPASVAGARTVQASDGTNTPTASFTVTPTVSLSSSTGAVGSSTTVTGAGFAAGSVTITYGGTNVATATAAADGSFSKAITIPTSPTGAHTVTATDSGSNTASSTFNVGGAGPSGGAAIALSSSSGNVGSTTTVSGTGFGAGPVALTFGSGSATATAAADGTFSQVITIPAHAAGSVTVTGTQGTLAPTATFTVTSNISLSATSGPVSTVVTITGNGFDGNTGANHVTITNIDATTSHATEDATGHFTASITIPASTAGAHTITASDGTNAPTSSFSVTPSTSLTTASGPVGTTTTVSGTGFAGSATVTIKYDGAALATATTNAAGSFSTASPVTVPSSTTGAHTIASSDGTNSASSTFSVGAGGPSGGAAISLSTSTGPVGTTTTVSGTGFGAGPVALTFGSGSATATADSTGAFSTSITIPAHIVGALTVTATQGSLAPTATFTVTSNISLSPATGPVGTVVTISGNGFDGNTGVNHISISNIDESTSFATEDATGHFSTSITIPASTAGSHNIVASDGTHSPAASFSVTPSTTLSASSGIVGTSVTVTGAGFAPTSVVTIAFGGANLHTVTTDTNGAFSQAVIIPTASLGTHSIVSTDASSNSASSNFNVGLSAIAVSPASGAVGTTVTVTGSGYGANAVIGISYDGTRVTTTPASVIAGSTGTFSATFTVPPSAFAIHTVDATVISFGAQSNGINTSTADFTVNTSTLTLSPDVGPSGATVDVTGDGFSAVTEGSVTFGATTVASSTTDSQGHFSNTFTVPTNPSGTYTVSATFGASSASKTFTVNSAPLIASPSEGPVGTPVTISGNGFGADLPVTIKYEGTNVATVLSDGSGVISKIIVIPPSVVGSHTITATDGTHSPTASFTVDPAITASPPSGGIIGSTVTVKGTGYAAGAEVTISGDIVPEGTTITPDSTGSFTTTFVAGTGVGGVHGVDAADASSNSANAQFIILPHLTSVSPGSGKFGDIITVSGNGFSHVTEGTSVQFDGSDVITAASDQINPDATGSFSGATFTVPAGAKGAHTVTGTDTSIPHTTADVPFTITGPVISLSPADGPKGTDIMITGNGYAASSAMTFTFGGAAITPTEATTTGTDGSFVANIIVPTTGTTAGVSKTVVATDSALPLPHNSANAIFSNTAPTLAIDVNSGPPGTIITVSGSHYIPGATLSIKFNGVTVSSAVADGTGAIPPSTTITVPATTAGAKPIVVTDGTNTSPSLTFTVKLPTITIAPTTGPGNTVVTVTGSNYIPNAALTVKFDATTVTTTTATALGAIPGGVTFAVPPAASGGAHTVTVTDGTNTSPGATFTKTTPTLTIGATNGKPGDQITVSAGTNYIPGSTLTIKLDGTDVTTTPAIITATGTGAFPTGVKFIVPAATAGSHVVIATDGTNNSPNVVFQVKPVIIVNPTSGPVGTMITITGEGYKGTSAVAVLTFNGVPELTQLTSPDTDASGTFTTNAFAVPATSAGSKNVIGTDSAVPTANTFTATFAVTTPTLTIAPITGHGGTVVTVTGSNYIPEATLTVKFDGSTVTTTTATASGAIPGGVTFAVPGGATNAAHTVTVTDGTNTSPGMTFTKTAQTLTVSPTTGIVGAQIGVSGSNYLESTTLTVKVDGNTVTTVPGTLTSTPTGTIPTGAKFIVPATTKGSHTVTVTDGTNTSPNAALTVTPAITLSPTTGPATTPVTITGTGYASTSALTFTFAGATISPTEVSPTTDATGSFTVHITVPVPSPNTAGAKAVVARDASTNSATANFAYTLSQVHFSTTTGSVGSTVTVTGSSFIPGSALTIQFDGSTVSTVTATSTGTIPSGTSFTVPSTTSGTHRLTVLTTHGTVSTTSSTTAPAPAVAPTSFTVTTSISVSPTTGPAGTTVTVTGNGFAANTAVTFKYDTAIEGTLKTDASGHFTGSFKVPASTAGKHTISALDAKNNMATTTFART